MSNVIPFRKRRRKPKFNYWLLIAMVIGFAFFVYAAIVTEMHRPHQDIPSIAVHPKL
jgi:presenilin-like A22 family membrane protease